MKTLFATLIALTALPLLLLALDSPEHSPKAKGTGKIEGTVDYVVDGDTFKMNDAQKKRKVSIRLCGIDAPEKAMKGGKESTRALKQMIRGKNIKCVVVGSGTPCDGRSSASSYERIVAQCFLNGRDIAAKQVKTGKACNWTKYSGGAYDFSGACSK